MRLLAVVAHPDDESFGCGSLLAHAAAAGYDTAVLCATRGEAGESRIRSDDLAAMREAELRDAARILGVREVRVLGHPDGGVGPDIASEVRAVVDDFRPDIVVTLDAADGHPDHAAVRDATLEAVDRARHRPTATYLWCLVRSAMAEWARHHGVPDDGLGTPDEDITTVIDVAPHLATRLAAIRAHASQASPYDGLPPHLQQAFLAVDRLRLVRGDDLLATR